MDLRKIPQSGDMSHRGFLSQLFGPLRIVVLEVMFFFALLGESDIGFKKNPESGDLSHRGFVRIVWTFRDWKFRGYVLSCF